MSNAGLDKLVRTWRGIASLMKATRHSPQAKKEKAMTKAEAINKAQSLLSAADSERGKQPSSIDWQKVDALATEANAYANLAVSLT